MSAVTMTKSQEKKSQNYFLMTMIITMWLVISRKSNFEKMATAPYAGKNDGF